MTEQLVHAQLVIRAGGDGKMDVRLADATRTLVAGKK